MTFNTESMACDNGINAGPLLYAIGDVHGRADLLEPLLDWIERDARQRARPPSVRFLGDIIDRGPDSRAAMDLVATTLRRWPGSILLLGNHDDWLLSLLAGRAADRDWYDFWLGQGGRETLLSYGADPDAPEGARDTILTTHPEHAVLLREALILDRQPEFVFVHAGIDPASSLDEQVRTTCLTVRAPFLNHVGRLAHIVVHGHSPQRPSRPTVTENRVSMDTGAFFSGVLSVVAIDPESGGMRFAATGAGGGVKPVEPVRLDRGLGTALDGRQ